ncbi:MAG: anti-sigma factor [Pseudomonadota bacterium]
MSALSAESDEVEHLAGEYVLGTLEGSGRREVERRLPTEEPLRRAVEAWEVRLHALTALAPPIDPPAALWARIEQRIVTAPTVAPRASPRASLRPGWPGWWTSLALWRTLAAGGMAATVLLAIRPDMAPLGASPTQYVVVLVAPGGQAPGWVVQVSSPRDLTLTPLARTAAPEDKALQFWTKADSWSAPVSLGLVRPGEPLRVRLDKLPALQPNQLFEITLEPPAGSPTGRPTGPIQYIGRAVKLNT